MPCYEFEGLTPVVDPAAYVHPTATLIGDVLVGPGCLVGPGASLRGDIGRIVLEAGANVQDNCTCHCFPGKDIIVEENGHVGHGAVLHSCRVGRNALVGMNAVVMDDVVIGADCFVAAQALVKAGTKIPPRSLAAGVPAKIIRELTDEEIAWKSQGTKVYQHLARRYLATGRAVDPLPAAEANRPSLPRIEYETKQR